MSRLLSRRRNHADDLSEEGSDGPDLSGSDEDYSGNESDDVSEAVTESEEEEEEEGEEEGTEGNGVPPGTLSDGDASKEGELKSRRTLDSERQFGVEGDEQGGSRKAGMAGAGNSTLGDEDEEIEYEDDRSDQKVGTKDGREKGKEAAARQSLGTSFEKKQKDMDEYRRKLREDPSFTPSIGKFWLHDDRFAGRGRGRGGFRGRGRPFGRSPGYRLPAPSEQNSKPRAPVESDVEVPDLSRGISNSYREMTPPRKVYDPSVADPTEKKWVHDKFEELANNDPGKLRHRKSWTPRDSETMRSTFRVGEHAVTITKRKSTPDFKASKELAEERNQEGGKLNGISAALSPASQKAKHPTQRYYTVGSGVGGRPAVDETGDQAPRQSKRYLGASRTQSRPDQPANDVEKVEKHTGNDLKKAVDAPEFQPAVATSVSSHTTSDPSWSEGRHKQSTKNRYNKTYPKSASPYDQPAEAVDNVPYATLSAASVGQPDPTTITIHPMMTSSGQIVLMTENGLMVPADGYASNYMYPQAYQNYSYVPQAQNPATPEGPGSSAASATPAFAYYGPGGQLYYAPSMFPSAINASVPPAMMGAISAPVPFYSNGMYIPQAMSMPMSVGPVISGQAIPVDVKSSPSVPVRIRRPDDAESEGKRVGNEAEKTTGAKTAETTA
ncbi:uncharacterized protein SPPG_00640 [Spizellomyces punctatus DAOM BR117]|uniref:Btz domain-containing protein n=1 Tax=Spizellomyces punctatus (strain DAOM BR117) TaxID=645134 RepID=A0A0L0HV35_SPIPD|nr:uncharacterized protein SPPG_00640 [Spizellomyces punctatus DAOM BR117]KND04952.1 hypothetical protein SPPG_00640 [Spizellomyces punctatus DAOM BR117]|eukprot:XP_016612991.1 hypothetical protein SPPG_00640 [Spizellomyces punctatus DAOM BR117]